MTEVAPPKSRRRKSMDASQLARKVNSRGIQDPPNRQGGTIEVLGQKGGIVFSRVLHAAALVLAIALTFSCSTPTAPTPPINSPEPPVPVQPSPPTGGTTSIEGDYSLTLTMSPSCSLPQEVRQRAYTARIREPRTGYLTVELGGADFVVLGDSPYYKAGFEGQRNGDALHFVIDNGYGAEYMFIERVDGTKNLFFEGIVEATVGSDGIVGTFGAEVRYFVPYTSSWLGQCTAPDHRMVFAR